MATTSIWRVNGWLGKVLIYIENPDKTENPDFFEKQDMGGKEAQGLADVIEYAVQQQKTSKAVENEGETVMRQFVSGVNCSPSTARDEMIAVKKRCCGVKNTRCWWLPIWTGKIICTIIL